MFDHTSAGHVHEVSGRQGHELQALVDAVLREKQARRATRGGFLHNSMIPVAVVIGNVVIALNRQRGQYGYVRV
jgi:hypothetical protein